MSARAHSRKNKGLPVMLACARLWPADPGRVAIPGPDVVIPRIAAHGVSPALQPGGALHVPMKKGGCTFLLTFSESRLYFSGQ